MEFEKLPIINGIMYSNGNIDNIEISVQDRKRTLCKQECNILCDNEIDYTYAYPSAELIVEEMNCKIICGGGSYGGDGFILAVSLDSNQMIWLASFDESNPFVSMYREKQQIYVTNNCDEVWRIDIIHSQCIEISIVKNGFYFGR